jgi:Putative prokaryotic signal transducing protein
MANETVVLKVFATEMDAVMARDVLHDAGVKAFVLKDDAGGMEPHLQRTNGVRLMVSGADAERADKILRTLTSSWKAS